MVAPAIEWRMSSATSQPSQGVGFCIAEGGTLLSLLWKRSAERARATSWSMN